MVENAQNNDLRLRWLKGIGFYGIHVLISTVAVFLVAVFLGAGIEHFINARIGDALFAGPVFPVEIGLGLLSGFFINKHLQCKSAKWAWVPFAAIVVLSDFPGKEGWGYTLKYLFGTQCGDCVEQLITIGPLYSSIAYSIGAWAGMKRSLGDLARKKSGTEPLALRVFLTGLYSVTVVVAVFVIAFSSVLGTLIVSHWAGLGVKAAFSGPFYWGEIAVGLIGGFLVGARVRPQLAKWVWVLPSIWVLVYMAYTAHLAGQIGIAHHIWTDFFTTGCADPGIACPQQSFGTFPFFSSLAYSFAAWLSSRMRNQRIGSDPNQGFAEPARS